jgi:transcriptional regulator of NAD metabolism
LYQLCFYFSDKPYNIFKLLEPKWANTIVNELVEEFRVDRELIVKHIQSDDNVRTVDLSDFEPQ